MTATSGAAGRPRSLLASPLRRSELLWAILFISPWIIGFVVFTAGPIVWSLAISFMEYDPLRGDAEFVGLENYERLTRDSRIRLSLTNTAYFTLFNVPGTIIIGLFLAMLLNRVSGRLAGIFRTIFYLPNVTPAIAVGTLFLMILNGHSGLLNQLLRAVGLPGPSWLTDPDWIKPGIIIMMLWTTGATVIILFAAMKNVPLEMYEAAKIDGANAWQQFRNITVPFISGPLFFVVVINTIASLQIFAEVFAMFQGRNVGGSAERASLFYVIYLFERAFQSFDFGYASAMAWLLFGIILVITLIQQRLSKRWVYYEGE